MNLYFIAGSIGDAIKNWFQGWFGALLSFIPKIFYQLLTPVFAVLDALQWIMRKVAGLDTIYMFNGAENVDGDIVIQFINMIFTGSSPVLSNIFWSMIILGVLMLILTTMIAVVRSEYTATDAKSASKGKIIGNSLKALASFAIVPIVCFFGIFLCNVILQALDKVSNASTSVTSADINASYFKSERTTTGDETYYNYTFFGYTVPTTTTPISGLVFKAAAYNANRARINDKFYKTMLDNEKVSANGAFTQNKGTDANSASQNCWLMDEAFANCFQLKSKTYIDREPFKTEHMFPITLNAGVTIIEQSLIESGYTYFDKNNTALVWYYYDLWSFDFIIAIGALIIILVLLLYLVFGLIKRIFELVILFLVAAPVASIMPLDGGNALKKWREKFVSKTIGVYGPIIGLNLFFVILTLLQTLQLTGIPIIDKIVNLLFVIAGLAMVKDFTKMISELIGGEDTMGSGADKAKDIGATAAKIGKTAAAFAGGSAMVMKAGSLGVKGAQATQAVVNKHKKTQAMEGTGRYSKDSQSYQNSLDNIADGVSDDEILTAAAETVSDQDAVKWLGSDKKALNKYAKNHNIDKVKPGESENAVWDKMTDEEKAEFKHEFASRNVSKMTEEDKKRTLQGLKETGQEEKFRQAAAEYKLESMSWQNRQGVIDANYRSRGQNERIRNRAIAAAGGLENYRNMSSEERNALYNESKHGNWQNKVGKGIEQRMQGIAQNSTFNVAPRKATIDGGKIELGSKPSEALAKAFLDFGKRCGSFAQHTMAAMSGPMMGEMKGLGGDMISIAQGKLKKEMDLASEVKNQKKLASAQGLAQESLGLGGANKKQAEPPPKQRPTELSEASIKQLANAINSNANKSNSVKLDDASIKKLGSTIAEKLNKKD
ncbi:MAG: hypothetical protein MR024_00460 [Firmicutes bacterium]|nr:hypothetical protein [Bacillota bacterium]